MTKKRIDRVSVFSECDAVVKDLPNERITSRLIGTRMGVSNTAVYKLVKQWREEAKKAQEELISQTQMSSKFVGALLAEVDARVTEMRQLDEQASTKMSQEMDEMAEQVGTLEAEILSLREQLDGRTIDLATTNEKLEQATAMTIANLEASNADNIIQRNNAQEALAKVNTRLTDVQNALQSKTLECAFTN